MIETKGLRRPRFDLVWKLFKKYLTDHKLNWLVLMPSNTEQLELSVELIKQLHRGVLQIPENFQLVTGSRRKSKATEDEDGKPRAKRRYPLSKDR